MTSERVKLYCLMRTRKFYLPHTPDARKIIQENDGDDEYE